MSSDKKSPAGGKEAAGGKAPAGGKQPAGGAGADANKLDGPPSFGGTPPANRPSKG